MMKRNKILKFFYCSFFCFGNIFLAQSQSITIEPEVQMKFVNESSVSNNDSLFSVTLVVDLPDTSDIKNLEINVIDTKSNSVKYTKQLALKDGLMLKSGVRASIEKDKLLIYIGDYRTIFTHYRFECYLLDNAKILKKNIKKEL
jgi:hypothetical protein